MDEEFHWLISIRRNKLDLWKRQKRFMDAKKLVGNQHEDSFQTWSGSVGRLAINDPRASAETQAAQRRKKVFRGCGTGKATSPDDLHLQNPARRPVVRKEDEFLHGRSVPAKSG